MRNNFKNREHFCVITVYVVVRKHFLKMKCFFITASSKHDHNDDDDDDDDDDIVVPERVPSAGSKDGGDRGLVAEWRRHGLQMQGRRCKTTQREPSETL